MRGFLRQDLNFSVRTLIKNFGFTLTAVLTLALGIGATTAIFSVVYAVFEPMPYPKTDQLVMVWSRVQGERNSVSPGNFLEWKRRNTSFQDLNAWSGGSFNVSTNERPEQIEGSPRTPGMFKMEGLPMFLGRDFLPEEGVPGQDAVVILSNRMWIKHFASDPAIIGKDIRAAGRNVRSHANAIVGATVFRCGTSQQPRRAHAPRNGPIERWSDYRTGPVRDEWHRGTTRKRVSKVEQGLGNHGATAAPQFPRTDDAQKSVAAVGCGWFSAADCLRQRCESAAGSRHVSST
jgi:hypothetical protein